MKILCIVCGKELNSKESVVCEECRLKRDSKIVENGKDVIVICKCLRYKRGKVWLNPPSFFYNTYESYLRSIVRRHYPKHEISELNEKSTTLVRENEIKKVEFVNGTCDICSRMHGGYYEGKIQIRGSITFIKKVEDEIIKIVKNNRHPLSFISKINYLKEGTDIYIGTKTLINKIKRKYCKEEIKISKELHGVKDGKKVYRITLLIREKGDSHDKKR